MGCIETLVLFKCYSLRASEHTAVLLLFHTVLIWLCCTCLFAGLTQKLTTLAGSQSVATAAAPPPAYELLGPSRPKPFPTWKHRYFKILIVGDSGLGKTTLVRALLSVPGQRLELHDGAAGASDA